MYKSMKQAMSEEKEKQVLLSFSKNRTFRFIQFLLFGFIFSAMATSLHAQEPRISIDARNTTVREVLKMVEAKSDYHFAYNNKLVDVTRKVDITANNEKISDILKRIFANTDVTFTVLDHQIVLASAKAMGAPIGQSTSERVSGRVIDEKGEALPGVTVVVKGTTTGTITDANGIYHLNNLPKETILQFSFVGMQNREVLIGENQSVLNISLSEVSTSLNELEVIGYGTQKKRDIIGSVATVKSDVFSKESGSPNFADLIEGQAAGVSVQESNGVPGSGANILIRGISSINAGIEPLWIIDGVPIITSSGLNNAAGTTDQSPMSLINPNDIESVEILKDAAATSIYGSRGSNGVIIVTTKTGKNVKASVNLDYSVGISQLPIHRVQYMNTTQWLSVMDEAGVDNGHGPFQPSDTYSLIPLSTLYLTRNQAENINTNWFDEIMQQGSTKNLNLSVMGGTTDNDYYLSVNYMDDISVMKGNELKRYVLRSNVDLHPLSNLKVGEKLTFSLSHNDRVKNNTDMSSGNDNGNNSGSSGGFDFLNTNAIPWFPVYNPGSTSVYYNPLTGMNPAATIDPANVIDQVDMYRLLGVVYAEYSIPYVKGLKFRSNVSLDLLQNYMNFWVNNIVREFGSYASDQSIVQQTLNYNLYGTFDRSFGLHKVNVVGGVEAEQSYSWSRVMAGEDLLGTYKQLGTPNEMMNMSSMLGGENYLLSYFGRGNYSFKDKYLAGISLRSDGSSNFTPEHRWGTFAAFSAGWIFSDESFMSWVGKNTFLKLRGSFGQTGNQSIPSNLQVTGYSSANPFGSPTLLSLNGTSIYNIGVKNLTWEVTDNTDFGLDFGFLNNRINGSFAFYNKLVKGLLLQAPVPLSTGIVQNSSIWENIGNLLNRGFEFNISSTNISNHDFVWTTNFNLSFNHNEVTTLTPQLDNNGMGMISGDYNQFITKAGHELDEFYLAEDAGVDPQTGFRMIYVRDNAYYNKTGETRRLKDANGVDETIMATSANIANNYFDHKGESCLPTYFGGFTNSFKYKGLELKFLISFSGGNYILDFVSRRNLSTNLVGPMETAFLGNYWKKPGDIAKYQRLDYNGNVNLPGGTIYTFDSRTALDTWASRGDFAKLKTITLDYTFAKPICEKLKLQSLRVFLSVDNLYTLTKYAGWDPEGLQFFDSDNLPPLLTTSIGLSIKF